MTPQEAIAKHGLGITVEFVPLSRSRNAGKEPPRRPDDLSLNWKLTLLKDGRAVYGPFDYQQGIGHAPAYKHAKGHRFSLHNFEAILLECEKGKHAVEMSHGFIAGKPLDPPSAADTLYCLLSDSDAIDYPTYEEWAPNLGFDPDSRKGEAVFRECVKIGLTLRAALSEVALAELREAFRGY